MSGQTVNFRERMGEHYPRFSPGEYVRRHAAIRERMARANLDVLVLYGGPGLGYHNQVNVHYVANYVDQVATYVVFPLEGAPVQFVSIYPWLPIGQIISVIDDVRVGSVGQVVEAMKDSGGGPWRRIGVVGSGGIAKSIPHDHYEVLREAFPAAELVTAADLLEEVRRIPSEEEMTWFRRGAAMTDHALRELVRAARPGVTDHELFAAIHASYLRQGGTFYFSWLGSTPMADPAMPYPWSHPSGRRLEQGDLILSEISAGYWGYAGQLGRPIALGEPPKLLRELFALAADVYQEACRGLVPHGRLRTVMDAAARIQDAGYTIQCPVIHGWGQRLTPPFCSVPGLDAWQSDPEIRFADRQLIMVEPNPCTPDLRAGIFLGDVNVVTPAGGQSLHATPMEFIVID